MTYRILHLQQTPSLLGETAAPSCLQPNFVSYADEMKVKDNDVVVIGGMVVEQNIHITLHKQKKMGIIKLQIFS